MIVHGELSGLLPGERTLASNLQIGRDTLRAALDILEAGEWISPREHGKRRQILQSGSSAAPLHRSRTQRIAFLSPKRLEQMPPKMLLEFDTLRDLLNKQGYELDLLTPGLFHLTNPTRKLEQLLGDESADAWVLYQCPPLVQAWFEEKKIPSLVRGHPQPGVTLPSIDEDWRAAAFHAGGLLKRNGHTSIGLMMPDVPLAGLRATEQGLFEAITDTGAGTVHRLVDRREPGSLTKLLKRAFKLKDPPTALVTTRSRQVLTTLTWLAERRLKIPDDLSVVALCYDGWFDHIIPSVTHYHLESRALARSVVRKILQITAGTSSGATGTFLIPEHVPGHSVRKIG